MSVAHHVAWQLENGKIPLGMKVLHHCDNPQCVRPSHLFLGTQMDNYKDMKNKGRERRAQGSEHYNAKLTEQDVAAIRKSYIRGKGRNRRGNSQQLANRFGITQAGIYDVLNRTWRHVK